MPVATFAKENGLNRETLRDWMNAYNNIHGKFINVNTVSKRENNIIEEKDVRVNMLSEVEKIKKSSHFSRFDHSVVVIEYKGLKVTTLLEQAVKPFVIQRKVFQTSGSYAGTSYTAKLFSIVQTCKINNISIERYFKYVLENIHCESVDSLLPYSSEIKKKNIVIVQSHLALFGG